jgi:hypothetical protein
MYELRINEKGRPVKFSRPIELDGFSEADIAEALKLAASLWNDLRRPRREIETAIVTETGRTVAAVEAGGCGPAQRRGQAPSAGRKPT